MELHAVFFCILQEEEEQVGGKKLQIIKAGLKKIIVTLTVIQFSVSLEG